MPRARRHLVCLADTPYYHVTARCVRRAFLCGVDRFSGRSYEHRRSWIEDRIRALSSIFCIEICAYAVMSNHYHVVVRLDPEGTSAWTDDEVLSRWTQLFRGPLLVQRYLAGSLLSNAEIDTVKSIIAVYRQRLGCLSWFMKCLNEPIARKANAEDRCTGHFWEARFHSQALRSERALLAAMAYVDLNPIRAGMAESPESSHYTSIQVRLEGDDASSVLAQAIERLVANGDLRRFDVPIRPLMPFSERQNTLDIEEPTAITLPMKALYYFQLVDNSGRCLDPRKTGRIDPSLCPILERLGLTTTEWLYASTEFRQFYKQTSRTA